ncbi:MAG: 3-oxoacyl-ACP synthase, partial [Myxococcota bacterium]
MPNPKTRFLGTGSFLPEQVRTNDDIRDMGVDTCDEWISTRTGIRERRIAAPTMQTSDMATAAAIQALEMAELSAQDLDMVIVATVTGDMPMPATAAFVQQKL